MQKINENHIFAGVQRDLSVSKQPTLFLYDAKNIRLTARENDTLMSITNEKGTSTTNQTISGIYIGHCLLNQYLVVFSTNTTTDEATSLNADYITRFNLETISTDSVNSKKVLYNGNLGFSTLNPIDAIGSFETNLILKVYWVDNKNQPRVINITDERIQLRGTPVLENSTSTYGSNYPFNDTSFDFSQKLALGETVKVLKLFGLGGSFAPGVIQYAFTYYNKYGLESNIFYTTPLLYISPKDRGASPEDTSIDNAFRIKIWGLDSNFEYVRIYSIQRTSLNGVPLCKRVQDLKIQNAEHVVNVGDVLTFTDTGTEGDTIDPTELLYKGSEKIIAKTLELKDNTLFLGNIRKESNYLTEEEQAAVATKLLGETFSIYDRTFNVEEVFSNDYIYGSQLNATTTETGINQTSVPCGGFKLYDYYRCGVQFQHENGKWSDPVFLKDIQILPNNSNGPSYSQNSSEVTVPGIELLVAPYPNSSDILYKLRQKGYKKIRAVVVFPTIYDRVSLCQGVACPTVYTDAHRTYTDSLNANNILGKDDLYAQPSWFFRTNKIGSTTPTTIPRPDITASGGPSFTIEYTKKLTDGRSGSQPPYSYYLLDDTLAPSVETFNRVEVQGLFNAENQFQVDRTLSTLHSPDLVFEDNYQTLTWDNLKTRKLGYVQFKKTLSSINIEIETPAISSDITEGAENIVSVKDDSEGIMSGLFYKDFVVDDYNNSAYSPLSTEGSWVRWLVYPWHRNGSLNNDVDRPLNCGVRSAVLKKKIISNLRYADTVWGSKVDSNSLMDFKLFASNEVTIEKLDINNESKVYQGNIDTLLNPDEEDGTYFAYDADTFNATNINTSIDSTNWGKVYTPPTYPNEHTLWKYNSTTHTWNPFSGANYFVGDYDTKVSRFAAPVRMKYKSTIHLVGQFSSEDNNNCALPVYDIIRSGDNSVLGEPDYRQTMFGGKTDDAKKANTWIPCGEPVTLSTLGFTLLYSYGDTYYQRWDCLKTYPFTKEDVNQIVEIGSFMLESRVNIDGRYDRNRGLSNNIMMSPQNFNLLNPVYSQVNNFFVYKIIDSDLYKDPSYINQITWSKEKHAGSDVDAWTNITLASIQELDGSKGAIESLNVWKDELYCFQKKGISRILFNSRVLIPVSDGVPIEISNSYKVDGYKYIGDGIGCSSSRLVKETPVGIYFIDSVGSHLIQISEGLTDLSEKCNMTSLFKKVSESQDPIQKLTYDDINHDLYAVLNTLAICFSEKLGLFTGTYDYGGVHLIETCNGKVFTLHSTTLWEMFGGAYCNIFGNKVSWDFTFIANGLNNNTSTLDKIFTNLEFRANVEGDYNTENSAFSSFKLPVDSIEVWNEYQHGYLALAHLKGLQAAKHHPNSILGPSNLSRKFRIWRCDIPRNNVPLTAVGNIPYSTDNALGISRIGKSNDRIRNPWIYIKLKKVANLQTDLDKTELHDIVVSYFI